MSNTPLPTVEIVRILPTKVWIESGIMGERAVMRQHEGDKPFEYCVFNYDYAHTSNAQTMSDATAIAMSLTQERPIEHRNREYKFDAHAAAVSADARRTAEYWKAEHSAGNERIKVLEDVLRMALAELDELPVWWSNTGHVCNAARAALGDKT